MKRLPLLLALLVTNAALVAGGEGPSRATPETSSIQSQCEPLIGEERNAFLKAHNEARAGAGLAPLAWSDDVAEFAADWLRELEDGYREALRNGKSLTLKHRPADGEFAQKYGENIAYRRGTNGDPPADSDWAVSGWLEEQAAFDRLNVDHAYRVGDEEGKLDEDGRPIVVGHYTQLMWKDHTTLGAARMLITVADASGEVTTHVIVVCNYGPVAGNIIGEAPF